MSAANWLADFARQARETNDAARIRLLRIDDAAFNYRETDPDHSVALYEQGRVLAEQIGDPWMLLRFRRLYVHALLHFKRDYKKALEPAIANALEARKSQYEQCPERFWVYTDLVTAHGDVDPEGYADVVRDTLAQLDAEGPMPLGQRLYELALRRDVALARDALDEAADLAAKGQAVMEGEPGSTSDHYAVFNWSGWCVIHFRRGAWDDLAEAAAQGQEVADKVGHKMEQSELLLWQALLACKSGDEERARSLRLRATNQVGRLRMPPSDPFFEALSAYHEQGGEAGAALAARDRELAAVEAQGRTVAEVRCRLHRCRLLAQLGRLVVGELEDARTVARRLRFPDRHLAALDKLGNLG